PRVAIHHLALRYHAIVAGQAHGALAEFVLLRCVRCSFARQGFHICGAKRDRVAQQRGYVLSEQSVATAEWIVERYGISSCVTAAARCAAVRGVAARATAAAVLVGTENVVSD